MKKIIFKISSALLWAAFVPFAPGCVNDNGNYDYSTDGKAITISLRMCQNPVDPTKYAYVFTQDEEVVIKAEYTINDITLTKNELSFEWILGDEIVSREETLEAGFYPSARYSGLIIITDTRYNQKYASEFDFQVDPAYTDGWAILSEQNGMAQLGYLHIDTSSEDGSYEFIGDVYGKANNGAQLAEGSHDMSYHQYNMDGIAWGLSIVQPGSEGPIDLNPTDMSVWGKIKDNFIGGSAPEEDFKSVVYKEEHVCAITESGDVYVREEGTYNDKIVPHTGKFPSTPAYSPGGLKITKWLNNSRAASGIFSQTFVLGYNDATEGCVMIRKGKIVPFSDDFFTNDPEPHRNGPGWDGTNSYPDITFPNPADLSAYNVIAFEQAGPDYTNFASAPVSVAIFLQKKSDGKYYLLSFEFYAEEYLYPAVDIDLLLFYPLPDTFDPQHMLHCGTLGGTNANIFLTDKTNMNLYYIDINAGTTRKVYTSTSPITVIHPGEVGNGMFPGIYDQLFVVGTETGEISVLKIDAEALALGNAKTVYSENPGVGKITGVEFLSNNWISY